MHDIGLLYEFEPDRTLLVCSITPTRLKIDGVWCMGRMITSIVTHMMHALQYLFILYVCPDLK